MQVGVTKFSSSGLENEIHPIRTRYVFFFLTSIRQFGTSNTGECTQQNLLRNIVIVYFIFYSTCLLYFWTKIEKKGHCSGFRSQKCCHAMNHVYFLRWSGVGEFILIQRAHVALGLSNFDKNGKEYSAVILMHYNAAVNRDSTYSGVLVFPVSSGCLSKGNF
jgi:hypothetical protein